MQLRITPKRRRRFLKPSNLRAWIAAFIRRQPAAAPIPLEGIVDRYLSDTGSEGLRGEDQSMRSLRRGIVEALAKVWEIETAAGDLVPNALLLPFERRAGKFHFTIPAGTVLNMDSGFIHKELCDAGTVTAGTACLFSCTYCSVGGTMFRSPQTRILRLLKIDHGDAVIRRMDAAQTLRDQLTRGNGSNRFDDPNDRRVAILSPIVDPLSNIEHLEETVELISIIHEHTSWDVRVLTKSMLVGKLADRVPEERRHRVIYGLSVGILDDAMARAVEKLTSAPSRRLEAYNELQRRGLRTYSMHCPVLPQEDYGAYAAALAARTNWSGDEHVWAEALNRRGDSNQKTIAALQEAGFTAEAGRLREVTRSRAAWEFGYNRPLFEALADVCPPGKLRYLVYPGDGDRDYWLGRRDRGAVVLRNENPLKD